MQKFKWFQHYSFKFQRKLFFPFFHPTNITTTTRKNRIEIWNLENRKIKYFVFTK